jgi:sugar-specific transcriptional regulator TrmB
MKIQPILQKLGFSPQDAEVYLAILKVGESAVGAIINQTGFHRDLVYGALTRLEQQGLVQSLEKKKIRHYQAIDPTVLVRKEQQKVELAMSLLPTLKELYTQPAVAVKIYEGSEGLEEIEKDWADSLKDGEEFYCIGGAGEAWYEVAKPFYKKYHDKLLKRKIIFKTVTFANEAKGIAKYENPKFNPVRILPENFRVPSSSVIYADKLLINIFGEQFIGVVIQSKQISQAYRHYFNSLWKMAKIVK